LLQREAQETATHAESVFPGVDQSALDYGLPQ